MYGFGSVMLGMVCEILMGSVCLWVLGIVEIVVVLENGES